VLLLLRASPTQPCNTQLYTGAPSLASHMRHLHLRSAMAPSYGQSPAEHQLGDPWLSIVLTLCHILHSISHWPVLLYFINTSCTCCCITQRPRTRGTPQHNSTAAALRRPTRPTCSAFTCRAPSPPS
jgi:hypothetical protein